MRDRLLVWCSHCEVQVEQLENDASTGEVDREEIVNRLKDDLQALDNARSEIRELGRSLIAQGTADIQPQLNDYLQIEDDVLLKLAQMQVRLAQRDQERQLNAMDSLSIPRSSAANISLSDSGMYSYALEPDAVQGSMPMAGDDIAQSVAVTPKRPSQLIPTELTFLPPKPVEETTGAKQRTYADVAKTPVMSSPVRSNPPLVSIKTDSERHLELALDEWRQRLARLDHLIKTTIGNEPSPDAANAIVNISSFVSVVNEMNIHVASRTNEKFLMGFRLEWWPLVDLLTI